MPADLQGLASVDLGSTKQIGPRLVADGRDETCLKLAARGFAGSTRMHTWSIGWSRSARKA